MLALVMLGALRQDDARLHHRKTGRSIRQQPSIRVNIYRAAGSIAQNDSGLAFEEQYPQPVACYTPPIAMGYEVRS